MPDWCHGERGMLAYTIEVRDQGDTGFILPAAQIIPCAQENLQAALALAERAVIAAHFFTPRGQPTVITQNLATNIRVDIRNAPQFTLDASTAKIWWRVGSTAAFTPSTLTPINAMQFQATLPAVACGQRLEWYYEVQTTGPSPIATRWPNDAPASVFSATAGRGALNFDFNAVAGWTTAVNGATAGTWARGTPISSPNWPYDPRHDADNIGASQCYVTGNSNNNDLDNGSVLLTSPVINATGLLNTGERATFAYAYYLHHVSLAGGDSLKTEISSNGGASWTQVALHTDSAGANWRYHRITQADLAALGVPITSAMQLRFTATDGNPQSLVEAGIDDVRVWGDCGSTNCPADANRSGAVDVDDLVSVILSWGACGPASSSPPGPPCPADIAPQGGNGQVDVDDLIAVILGWGVCP